MRSELTVEDYIHGIKAGDLAIFSRAITLVESKKKEHTKLAADLIKEILPMTGRARRIGISGTPGVGKSTFLENFGMFLIGLGHKVAVLAVDPTSQVTGGAILGDKTRMHELSGHKNAYVRPSPSGQTLGGIAAKTRESLLLCDAFGFDYIFVETVGVGQSEVSVANIVDLFILLMQPGSGDELQGIKRGILEVSDLVVVNKSDGDQESVSKIAQHDYQKSISILQGDNSGFETRVLRCSSLYKKGFNEVKSFIDSFFHFYDENDLLTVKRQDQIQNWMKDLIKEKFKIHMNNHDEFKELFKSELKGVQSGSLSAINSVNKLFDILLEQR